MKVRATALGEYPEGRWRQPGEEFDVTKQKFSKNWMDKIEPDKPEKSEPEKSEPEKKQNPKGSPTSNGTDPMKVDKPI